MVGVWSTHALSRPWVKIECDIGKTRGVLVPVHIEEISPLDRPAAFWNIQFDDLSDFDGNVEHAGWLKFVRALSRTLKRPDILERENARQGPSNAPIDADVREELHRLRAVVAEMSSTNAGAETSVEVTNRDLIPNRNNGRVSARPLDKLHQTFTRILNQARYPLGSEKPIPFFNWAVAFATSSVWALIALSFEIRLASPIVFDAGLTMISELGTSGELWVFGVVFFALCSLVTFAFGAVLSIYCVAVRVAPAFITHLVIFGMVKSCLCLGATAFLFGSESSQFGQYDYGNSPELAQEEIATRIEYFCCGLASIVGAGLSIAFAKRHLAPGSRE